MAPVVSISDRVLLERHTRGDRDAFAQLMQTYSTPIYGYLARSGIRGADRDDLFQEVFCKVHRASLRRLPDGPIRPWLFTIAVNTVRDAFRKKKVRSIVKLDEDPASDSPARSDGPDQIAESNETASFLDAQIARLPMEQREALLLIAVEGMSLEQVAEVIGAPTNTIKTRLRRARVSLAEAMQRRQKIEEREAGR